ncbi:MAG: hypothetical protein RI991_618, partial [Bacteroidota bacterium]
MRKILLLLCGVLFLAGQLSAQNRTVSGKVTDAAGAAVSNASVIVKGTRIGTTSNASGNFSFSVPSNAKALIVSAVGLASLEVSIPASGNVNVTLQQDDKKLEEVIITGYSVRRKRDEAGAVSTVRGKEIENLPNPSLDKALQGRAAGVLVQSNSGIPGGGINVRIRGTGSFLAGTQPLYVIDGVQLNTRSDANYTESNPLAFLNPNDIESIDILKDAASAAIYGAQASNGVVIVTTKKGKAGKTKFQFNTYVGQATALKKLEVLNSQQLFQLRAEAVGNTNNLPANDLAIQRFVLNEFRVNVVPITTSKLAADAIAALPTYDWQ